jgi:hypothetical protein
MNIMNDRVLAAVVYTTTKAKGAPLFSAADPKDVEVSRSVGAFFVSYVAGGPLARHDRAKVAKALRAFNGTLITSDEHAEVVAEALFDVVGTVIDNVY